VSIAPTAGANRLDDEPAVAGTSTTFRRLAGINAFWFGGGAHWQPISISLLPVGAIMVAGNAPELVVGRATAAGGIFAMLVPILIGYLSDRTSSRWGRRRPWMVAGTVFNVIGLGLLAVAGSPSMLIFAYVFTQIANNAAGAAYAGVIPDVVAPAERGRASGLLGTMNQLGTVVGVGLVGILLKQLGSNRDGLLAGYSVIAVLLVVSLVISVRTIHEEASDFRTERAALPKRVIPAAGMAAGAAFLTCLVSVLALLMLPLGSSGWIAGVTAVVAGAVLLATGLRIAALREFFSPFRSPDFFWVFLTRFLTTLGIWSILPFVTFYFRDVIHAGNAGASSALWLLAVIAGAVVPSIVGGYLSDRLGRRKLFVYLSSGIQATVASVLVIGLITSLPLMYALGIVYGIGYGMYYAVDWALACDVLPDRQTSAGKDMGLWHTSLTLPQALAPAVLAGVLFYFNQAGHTVLGVATGNNLGFRFVFGGAALWFILGTVMVHRIRGVR
jgi:MFS family permease